MNTSVRLINDNYISPETAVRKFRSARKFRTPLYLYGVTGIGKTSLVMNNLNMKRCTYYSAADTAAEMVEIKEYEGERTVILDDLHCVTDSAQRELFSAKIRQLLDQDNVWLILIGRCPFPRWLLGLRTKYMFVEIPEKDFLLTLEQQKIYTERAGLVFSEEEHRKIWQVGRGIPMSLVFFVMEKGDLERTKKRVWDFLETQVYDQWDTELQDFFMDVSITESFTLQLAAMLTGRNDVEQLIAEAELTGNFLISAGQMVFGNADGKCVFPCSRGFTGNGPRTRSNGCIIRQVCITNLQAGFLKPLRCMKNIRIWIVFPDCLFPTQERILPVATILNFANIIWLFLIGSWQTALF